ncbi:MAG: alpha-E domain-containing protein [Chromatiaceae bacterium]|nr:alpha-E domain-containing protein [Gammaproteobacteria bacterium]MCP5446402.1 alpha-E domain-containing protein [Chromatiaceae bacterium]MCB1860763.1 alpha-E domain-containing protein [Gammaproteobacteria bacterium]MCB1872068.1 alpha-E domain-containing protein [Gammaproteobacteria bacterium]MCB1880425.1 alpha-E domain-containing protein [Gammaproteobacteria bacterium]
MLSRVAEHLYWISRYVERAENTARLISVNSNLLLDLPDGIAPGWEPLVDIMGVRSDFDKRFKEPDERQVLKFLIADRSNAGSILSSLHFARENCRTVRDILPREIWEELNELYLYAQENVTVGLTKRGRFGFLRRVLYGSQLFIGILASVQSRDEAFDFLRIGRYLERADMTTRIIDVRSADLLPDDVADLRPFDTIQWVSVLHSLSAYQMYRRHMQTRVRRDAVLRFLFKDLHFPRAVRYCLDVVGECLGDLKNNEQALKSVHALVRKIDRTNVDTLDQTSLHEYIDDLQLNIIKLHNTMAVAYFPKSGQQQQQG